MQNLNPIDGKLMDRQVKDREKALKNYRLHGILRTHGKDAIEAMLERDKNVFSLITETLSAELAKDPSNLYLLQKLYEFAFYATSAQRRQVVKTDNIYLELAKSPGDPHVLLKLCLLRKDDSDLALWVLRTIVSEEFEAAAIKDFFQRIKGGYRRSLLEKAFESSDFKQDFCEAAISGAKSSSDAHKFLDVILGLLESYLHHHTSDKSVGYVVRTLGAKKVQLSQAGKFLDEIEVKDKEQKQKASESGILAEKKTRQEEIAEIQKQIHLVEFGERRKMYAQLIELLALEERFEESQKAFEEACALYDVNGTEIELAHLKSLDFASKKGRAKLLGLDRLKIVKLQYTFEPTSDNRLNYGIVLYEIGNIPEAITILKMDNPPSNRTGETLYYLGKAYLALGYEYCSVAVECFELIMKNHLKGIGTFEIEYSLDLALIRRDFVGDKEKARGLLRSILAHDLYFMDALRIYKEQVPAIDCEPLEFSEEAQSVEFSKVPRLVPENERGKRPLKSGEEIDYQEIQEKLMVSGGTAEENYYVGVSLLRMGKPMSLEALIYLQKASRSVDSRLCVSSLFFSALIICSEYKLPDLAKYIFEKHIQPFDIIPIKHFAYFLGMIEYRLGNFLEAHKQFSLAQSVLREKDGNFKADLLEMIQKSYQKVIEKK